MAMLNDQAFGTIRTKVILNSNLVDFVLLTGGITHIAVPGSVVALMASQPKNPRSDNEAADIPPGCLLFIFLISYRFGGLFIFSLCRG